MEESIGIEPRKQMRILGICPQGWHLPSDWECIELENEIIRNTTRYARVSQNISPDGTIGLLPQDNNGSGDLIVDTRGSQVPIMKNPCPILSSSYPNTGGISNSVSASGFSPVVRIWMTTWAHKLLLEQ